MSNHCPPHTYSVDPFPDCFPCDNVCKGKEYWELENCKKACPDEYERLHQIAAPDYTVLIISVTVAFIFVGVLVFALANWIFIRRRRACRRNDDQQNDDGANIEMLPLEGETGGEMKQPVQPTEDPYLKPDFLQNGTNHQPVDHQQTGA